ncbi:MAG: hypothetical protein ACLTSX_08385 [Collinsella sp.]
MMRVLGPDHCRCIAARIDASSWSPGRIATISGARGDAVLRGHGRPALRRPLPRHRPSRHLRVLRARPHRCTEYDQMGIGSEFAPETLNLNDVQDQVLPKRNGLNRPDRDVPIKGGFYGSAGRGVKKLRAHAKAAVRR